MKKLFLKTSLAITICLLTVSFVGAQSLVSHMQGGVLPNAPDYEWWYGCSPTSAGMMMGYYDINSYGGLYYPDLVPGGTAELSNYGNPGARANQAIASDGHIADFYSGGNGASGDDVAPPHHSFNSLADFMGTSQDAYGSSNGSTWFYNYGDGSRLYAWEMPGHGLADVSGMYGLWEYEQYAGYGLGTVNDQMIYNQYIVELGRTYGFSWADYMAEIDAGRPVMIHVAGHSMFGYGYDAQTQQVLLHNTWWAGEQSMTWGGSYYGMDHYGVTVFEPTGGVIPEPGTFLLLGSGLLALGCFRKIRKKKRV